MANDERFLVSGWEDDLNDIDEEENPHGKQDSIISFVCCSSYFNILETPEKEILWAAENGDIVKLESLINNDPSLIHITDKDGYTPLHRACYSNHIKIVEYLIEHGANISAKTQMQWEPLHSCCQWNHKECALKLIQNGADVNAQSEGSKILNMTNFNLMSN